MIFVLVLVVFSSGTFSKTWQKSDGKFTDGVWTTYKEDDGLTDNDVWTVVVDQKGGIWVGTDDGGASWNLIAEDVEASSGSCSWEPSDVQTTMFLVRISDESDSDLMDESDNTFIISVIVSVDEMLPEEFAVLQNSPNPFNPNTSISFTLPEAGRISLEIYNMTGQRIDTLVDGFLNAGCHTVTWNGSKFSAGLYFYRITTGYLTQTKKMLLIK